MSEPIKAGDLVMVVRGHECFMRERGGLIFTVAQIVPQVGGGWHCPRCGTGDLARYDLWGATISSKSNGKGVPLSWLKRIPPLGELDEVKHEEEIAA